MVLVDPSNWMVFEFGTVPLVFSVKVVAPKTITSCSGTYMVPASLVLMVPKVPPSLRITTPHRILPFPVPASVWTPMLQRSPVTVHGNVAVTKSVLTRELATPVLLTMIRALSTGRLFRKTRAGTNGCAGSIVCELPGGINKLLCKMNLVRFFGFGFASPFRFLGSIKFCHPKGARVRGPWPPNE